MKRKLEETMDQQAPAACWQARLLVIQTLSKKAQRNQRGHDFTEEVQVTRVRIELKTLLKRFALIHRSPDAGHRRSDVVGV